MNDKNYKRRPGRLPSDRLSSIRQHINLAIERYPRRADVAQSYVEIGGVRCLVLEPEVNTGQILYFHGGGFRMGSPEVPAGFLSEVANRSECQVIIPCYGLAPENPFPGAVLDGVSVLNQLSRENPLFVAGDSAGGNLATVSTLWNAERVSALILLSPWLDLRVEADSYTTNGQIDTVFSQEAARDASEMYLQGYSPQDPGVSPLLSDLSNIPDVMMVTGSREVLLDDSVSFARRLALQNRSVILHLLEGMKHVEATLEPKGRNTEEVIHLVSDFVQARLVSH